VAAAVVAVADELRFIRRVIAANSPVTRDSLPLRSAIAQGSLTVAHDHAS
jgi:hypothetical protein